MKTRRNLKLYLVAILGVFVLALILGLPQKTKAIVENAATGTVYVEEDEVIDDNFVKIGQSINIEGQVNGDVVAAAETITVDGIVAGDVIAAANSIVIRGEVKGNVRAAGGNVLIDADIGKNVSILAGQVQITKNAVIGWSMGCYSGTLDLDGAVNGNLTASSGQIMIDGQIGGNADIPAESGQVVFESNAKVGKDVTYVGEAKPTIEPGAEIEGEVKQRTTGIVDVPKQGDMASLLGFSTVFWKLAQLFGLLVLGLVIVTLLPKESQQVGEKMLKETSKSIGFGFLVLIVTPIVCLVLLITIAGIPLAIFIFALWGVAVMMAKVFVSLLVGQKVLAYVLKDKIKSKKLNLLWPLVVGAILYTLVTSIPYVGGVIKIVAIVWALGAFFEVKRNLIKQQNT